MSKKKIIIIKNNVFKPSLHTKNYLVESMLQKYAENSDLNMSIKIQTCIWTPAHPLNLQEYFIAATFRP